MTQITFQGECMVEEENLELSLLDIALKHNIPHFHVCGRVGRCSTCRVRIVEHPENLSSRNAVEARFARKRSLPDDVRLACQTLVTGPVTVRRLVRDDTDVDMVTRESFQLAGSEQQLAVLFSDIRGFTGFTRRNPSYDVLHLLNRYYSAMGEAVLGHRGYLHQYYGDGLMALFGFYARDPQQICLDAVRAGLEMQDRLSGFNEYLVRNFDEEPMAIGIGIHYGDVLAGKIGHPRHVQLNVLGDTVNMASRVEAATKEVEWPLVISEEVYWNLGGSLLRVESFRTDLKGFPDGKRLYKVIEFLEPQTVAPRGPR